MRLLLEKGANIDDVEHSGYTPLMFTANVVILSIKLVFFAIKQKNLQVLIELNLFTH